ncbi:LysR family transcriptional regulator [Trinickia acidisoli]|uniref:LysR family transcriptional regulator n=1 Tax=Trinickia acidisoli TaxID=2767482 RepID=UPI001A8DE5FB|nr:LysR family transcriptional regulator [Trinickia acidisoli]
MRQPIDGSLDLLPSSALVELRHLRYFIAVAESGSFRLASERINITQPAITRQIHDLESILGATLFKRTVRGVELTLAGEVYLGEARKALAAVQAASLAVKRFVRGETGSLRLGVNDNASWDGPVPDALRALQRDHPQLAIHVSSLNTPRQYEALLAGSLDGGFVYLFGNTPAGICTRVLATHQVVLAVPNDWPLAKRRSVSLDELRDVPIVSFPRHVYPAYYDTLIAACREGGLTLRVTQEEQTESAILSLVSAGIGTALVNSANRSRAPARVAFVPIRSFPLRLPLAFAYPQTNDNPALARLIAVLKANGAQAKHAGR